MRSRDMQESQMKGHHVKRPAGHHVWDTHCLKRHAVPKQDLHEVVHVWTTVMKDTETL